MSNVSLPIVSQSADGELTTTSLIIAEGVEAQHQNVRELIEDNRVDFEEFRVLRFETGKPSGRGGRPQRWAVLNRDQAMLLMTYMRNSPVVREFKKNLVRAFSEMEKRLASQSPALPASYSEALRELAATVERAEAEAARAKALEAPAASWEAMAAPGGDLSVAAAAKVLSRVPGIEIGCDRLFAHMHRLGWIFRTKGNRAHWEADQGKGIKPGRVRHKLGSKFVNEKTGEWEMGNPTVRVTTKGLHELRLSLSPQTELEVA